MIQNGSPDITFMTMKLVDLRQERGSKVYHRFFVICPHADDIVVIERGRLHAVASDLTIRQRRVLVRCTAFSFRGLGKSATATAFLPGNCRRAGKKVIKTLFNELSVILPQSKNSKHLRYGTPLPIR